jgi:hypothetical protein
MDEPVPSAVGPLGAEGRQLAGLRPVRLPGHRVPPSPSTKDGSRTGVAPRKSARLKSGGIVPLPIHCSGSGCTEETALPLPGKIPYEQGVSLEDGWRAYNYPENRSVLFIRAKCREKGERSSQLSNKKVPVSLRD